MRKKPTLEDYHNMMRQIEALLIDSVKEQMMDANWIRAYFDIRLSTPRGQSLSRIYCELSDGSIVSLKTYPIEVDGLIRKIEKIKHKLLSDNWYGLLLIINRNGEVQIEFNYDSKCIGDRDFFFNEPQVPERFRKKIHP
jgi:hypothetical protein